MIIGYTAGVYDLFHVGHLNLLKNAKGMCDKLVVGVTVDSLVHYKGKNAMIPFEDRLEIVRSCKYVDAAIPQDDMDKLTVCKKLGASVMFVGDDWYDTPKWRQYEEEFSREGIKIVYFPYTKGISSTRITQALQTSRGWLNDASARMLHINTDTVGGNKAYCMSSYLALRYIEDENSDFYPGLHHTNIKSLPKAQRIPVKTPSDIDTAIRQQLENFRDLKKGVLLSGGMDSAIVASYLRGSDAYTFRFLGGKFQKEELSRAEYYAERYGLNLHYVDISWDTVISFLAPVMKAKAAPVHSIEPQIYQAALQAQNDGVEIMLIGESSDLIFGGMDQLLSQDWTFDDFMKRYIFTNPSDVLNEPVSMRHVFERYRIDGEMIDFLSFMDDIFSVESSSSYFNAFSAAGMKYYDPYAKLIMAEPLDLQRVRNGESKYLIRGLFSMKYPDIPIPEKNPMPRPVDEYFREWPGPSRSEFRKDLDIIKFTGNQKWQIYCLEKFLDMNEPKA